jgi:hypothetical protein
MKKTLQAIAARTKSRFSTASGNVVKTAAVVSGLVLSGMAQATALGTGISNVKTDAQTAVSAAIAIFAVAGVCAIAYGGNQMRKKGGDRGDDVTTGSIIWPMIGGMVLLCIALIGGILAEEAGGSSSNMGQGITVSN